jgi:Ca2+-binding RTX toxin-like protein
MAQVVGTSGADTLIGDLYQTDTVQGLAGDDILVFTHGFDRYDGGEGFDFIDFRQNRSISQPIKLSEPTYVSVEGAIGHEEAEYFDGSRSGSSLFIANGGDDGFHDGAGSDTLNGGAGRDVFFANSTFGTVTVDLQAGISSSVSGGQDRLIDIEVVHLSSGNDSGWGSDRADEISGQGGDDWLYGGAGDDTLWGDVGGLGPSTRPLGSNHLFGGAGRDFLYLGVGGEAFGEDGDDSLALPELDAVLDGGAGRDMLVYGSSGAMTVDLAITGPQDTNSWTDSAIILRSIEDVRGGPSNDTVFGDSAGNYLSDDLGFDYIDGRGGDDSIDGGALNDTLIGGEGADYIRGLNNNDSVDGGAGADDVNGNMGQDHVDGGAGADTVRGGRDDDLVLGGLDDDPHVNGNLGADTVRGGDGADWVYGGQDDDRLYGEAGNDTLSGDLGFDLLNGGGGADRFVLRTQGGADWVEDFSGSGGDRIQIASGQHYSVSEHQGQTLVTLASGDSIGLVGVPLAAFDASWVVFG